MAISEKKILFGTTFSQKSFFLSGMWIFGKISPKTQKKKLPFTSEQLLILDKEQIVNKSLLTFVATAPEKNVLQQSHNYFFTFLPIQLLHVGCPWKKKKLYLYPSTYKASLQHVSIK